ncbi:MULTISPECIES: AbrB/MazE/SpoVT family DNA-binding domain-containing protein [Cytobacillus]|uniref:AbrB/MazE/SpoVT family DNA-binding domain-containing protein n=1 Tax=Cytobacillus stercorigallinarum TaxID=2762240 RepID=A0ABR8QSG0_9BACI|nr:AbrB/MazE/SpoVT family DNA-binding domain-containing protein [Cytobacillus stercorigallinarum]MBD7938455.1 AbrB/MazE/SpoVT family DNA-binding domain-containing protein [Cytobacillus stercorigallinarum]
MKSTGIVRKVDELGRIVIPKELRNTLEIYEKDPLEIFVENDRIILQKYNASKACQITGEIENDNLILADGKIVLSRKAAESLITEIRNKQSLLHFK